MSDHHVDGAPGLDVELGLREPVLEVFEARPFTDVVDEEHADGIAVVRSRDGPT